MSETQLSKAIQSALEALGCVVVRVQSGQLRGANGHVVKLAKEGTPDLWVCGYGWNGWLEVKTKDGPLSKEQGRWIRTVSAMGAEVHVVRSVEQALRVVAGRGAA